MSSPEVCGLRGAQRDLEITSMLPPVATSSHRWQSGYDIRTVQELLGHADVATTMIYTHVLKVGGGGVQSPLDSLP